MTGCGLNSNPPDYVMEFVAYKEGDGLIIDFVLADASGMPTTADGQVALSSVEATYKPEKQLKTLFNTSFWVWSESGCAGKTMLHAAGPLLSRSSTFRATTYCAGASRTARALKCAFPHSIFARSLSRRSSANSPLFVSTTK
jgi:hypothetical protein